MGGTSFLHELVSENANDLNLDVQVDLYDQGRGLGGRASHRFVKEERNELRFDHGCQFFRADTHTMQQLVAELKQRGAVKEWEGVFEAKKTDSTDETSDEIFDFFGMPDRGPYYVGGEEGGGINDLPLALAAMAQEKGLKNGVNVNINPGTRVSKLVQISSGKWRLEGVGGKAALHDTKESEARQAKHGTLGEDEDDGYDYVILTDISSTSFDSWHRASAGVPDGFAAQVRQRVGARVPLFTAIVAFEMSGGLSSVGITADTITFPLVPLNEGENRGFIWFASRNNSKPGLLKNKEGTQAAECWTLVSTPGYAANQIRLVPMQDDKTGEFLPQEPSYLIDTIGKELVKSFLTAMNISEGDANIIYTHAQRWGSALPAPRHLATDASSPSRVELAGVPYDIGTCSLAPTASTEPEGGMKNYYFDESLRLMQVGDMVSRMTPGLESAIVSAIDGAKLIKSLIKGDSCR